MKIAILFRGPVRPQPSSVVARFMEFMGHFRELPTGVEVHTYLATWNRWRGHKAAELLALDLFDNVLMQQAPTEAHRQRCTNLTKLPNGADIEPVFNMYYQSKTALDWIVRSDTYSYIIHTRTDLQMILGQHINDWFDPDYYVAPHVPGVFAPHAPHIRAEDLWICDQFGVATGENMHRAWDYGEISDLGRRIESADKPEAVLQGMIEDAGIPMRTAPYLTWNLDPSRNS